MAQQRLTRAEAREQTRRAILKTAREHFSDKGYRGATLEEIAEAAGYSKGAVYSNWSGKDTLFLDLLDEKRSSPGETALRVETASTGWALATLDFFLEAVHNPEVREALAARYRDVRNEIGASLAGDNGEGPGWGSWEEVGTVVMALGSGLIIQSALDPTSIDATLLQRALEQMLESSTRQRED